MSGDLLAELWIPRRAPNLNDLVRAAQRHQNAYNRIKESWAELVLLVVRKAHTFRAPRGPVSVHFELVEPDKRRDPDNIAAGVAKLVLDGLVKAGVLEGDGWRHVLGLSFSWRVGSPAGVRVVLTPEAALHSAGLVRGELGTDMELGMGTEGVNG